MRNVLISVALVPLLGAACGGGGGGGGGDHGHRVEILVENPAVELRGIWTGTATDQYDHYTVSMEIDADDLVHEHEPGTAVIVWGAESVGLEIGPGEFVEVGPDHYQFAYDTFDPDTGEVRDSVTGDLFITDTDLLEGTFATTSGTFGDFSLAFTDGFAQASISGDFAMAFADAATRDLFYVGEVQYDDFGTVIPGALSYLTDDLEGPIDPGAGFWPIIDGYLDLVDPAFGYYEGELFFASPDDTIFLSGYLGWDFGIYAGIFEDALGPGLFSFVPGE
jgi:hypothetical protein